MTISAHYHVLTTGFRWAEGLLWAKRLGGLLVSDTLANTVYLLRPGPDGWRRPWTRDVFLRPAGYAGPDPPGEEPGANGLALTLDERLVLCSPGKRGVFMLDEARWTKAPLALGFEGRRFNSPNDVALHPGGALYVTDPAYGLHGGADDPRRERSRSVYRVCPESGAVVLATDAVRDPNGIGLSPDGRTAFVSSTEGGRWHAFSVRPDGRTADGHVLLDVSVGNEQVDLGIGLALVKNLVELHRGSAEAHSDGIGEGSEFVVRLPLATGAPPSPEPAMAPAEDAPAGPLRVLVVDDNEDAARMSGMLLRSWGHEVRVAHDGAAALDRAVGFLPQVVLLDIGLPDMDGYEVARHVCRNPAHEGVQLVAVTGYGQDSDRARSKEAGFDVHLVKPVESSALRDLLAGVHPAAS